MNLAHSLKLAYPGYQLFILRRSALLWLLVRLFFFAFLLFVVRVDVLTAARQPSWGIPALLIWLDRVRNHEQLLHANLAASESWFWAIALVTSIGLDVLASLALGAF